MAIKQDKKKLKILWTHNFSTEDKIAGIFMHEIYEYARDNERDITLELFSMGNLRNLKDVIKSFIYIVSVAKKYHIIHAQYGSVCGLITTIATGGRNILTIRGSDWYGLPINVGIKGWLHSRIAVLATIVSSWFCKHIICVSQKMERELKNSAFVQEKNISVIPSAINHNIFNVKDLTGMPLADDISPETKKVLFVDAVGESVIKRKWLAESSVSFARQSGLQIALICPQGKSHSEVAKIMKSCDAILLTSLHEGWPNCIKEALACNLPFVSTDVSDLKEIADNEPSCFVAKTDSPEEIGMLLVKCLTCDAKRDLTKHVRDMGQEVILNRVLTTYKNLSEKVTKN